MKKSFFRSFVFFSAFLAASSMSCANVLAGDYIDIVVPAYFYPGVDGNGNGIDDWADMTAAVDDIGVTAIMNPASGAGLSANSDYQTAVSDLQNAGGIVIGYVPTTYGQKDINQVKADINNYITWYGVEGFFLDEMPTDWYMTYGVTDPETVFDYYAEIYDYIKNISTTYYIIGNSGNITCARFLDESTVDAIVTLEQNFAVETIVDTTPFDSSLHTPADWQGDYDITEFMIIQHNVPTASDMIDVIDAGMVKNYGLYYITDDSGANPYDRLPVYWDDFVAKIKEVSSE